MKVIGFSAKMGSGKSTAIELLRDEYPNTNFQLIKFADPIYEMQEALYERIDHVYTRPKDFIKDRKLLQFLGTDWARSLDSEIWVKIFKKTAQALAKHYPRPIILCDDVRFDNEAEAIHQLGGKVIKLTSHKSSERIDVSGAAHASEAGISEHLVDAQVPNNGTIEEFRKNLNTAYQILGIFN